MEAQRFALERAADEIESERMRWHGNGQEPIALVLDTGVLEHYAKDLDAVDWHEIADLRPHRFLYLVIPRVVLDEVDRHKKSRGNDTQSKLLRSNARAAIKALWGMFGTRERATTFRRVGIPNKEGRFELLNDSIEHVQLADADAELLDRSRTVRAYLPVKVITFDTGMALRGRAAGIDVVLYQADLDYEPSSGGPVAAGGA
jgi:predicted ribonuclease YlaK